MFFGRREHATIVMIWFLDRREHATLVMISFLDRREHATLVMIRFLDRREHATLVMIVFLDRREHATLVSNFTEAEVSDSESTTSDGVSYRYPALLILVYSPSPKSSLCG